ncbi:MAG TPA: hypothetical protein VGN83_04245 [Falsiroseomonas sp.]|nr:hypothetical protein [Falsiroseomonas sp.]
MPRERLCLVDGAGRVALLDPEATLAVAEAVRGSRAEAGIRLRVTRSPREDGVMATGDVAEIAREPDVAR